MPKDLRPFFEAYADRYMASDAEAIADLCSVPFLAVRSGVAIPLADRLTIVAHLEGNMAAYRASGADRAEIADMAVLEQGSHAALVTVRWHVRSADGTMIREFSTSYQLVAADPWRIVSYVNHDLVPRGTS